MIELELQCINLINFYFMHMIRGKVLGENEHKGLRKSQSSSFMRGQDKAQDLRAGGSKEEQIAEMMRVCG
ncbi:hypothetical protein OPV22_017459 [Ensete ventricosum]|uniref:Uncharacterized protein n=1 Tax=Ensete ventricosum TaxID=4639 RepID=A0AAV8QNC7_ENSVE|nr:hypothetical protein OPV22_017459 [Ensete ventricosum]